MIRAEHELKETQAHMHQQATNNLDHAHAMHPAKCLDLFRFFGDTSPTNLGRPLVSFFRCCCVFCFRFSKRSFRACIRLTQHIQTKRMSGVQLSRYGQLPSTFTDGICDAKMSQCEQVQSPQNLGTWKLKQARNSSLFRNSTCDVFRQAKALVRVTKYNLPTIPFSPEKKTHDNRSKQGFTAEAAPTEGRILYCKGSSRCTKIPIKASKAQSP